jgi:uncharacterized protein (DUF302 family)
MYMFLRWVTTQEHDQDQERSMTTHNTQPNNQPANAQGVSAITGIGKAAGVLLLCAVSVGVTLVCVRLTEATHGKSDRDEPADRGRISVEHVRVKTDRSFAEVTAAFEARLGKFDPQVYQRLREGGEAKEVRARIEAMAGPSGFMLFDRRDHGKLLRLVGQQRKAVQYVVGNPLFAVEMTRHVVGASLYAPLRVLIYEDDDGKTCIEYDKPSSLFGQFQDERVGRMAATLDEKLENLTAKAARGESH